MDANTARTTSGSAYFGGLWGSAAGPDSEAFVTASTLALDGDAITLFLRIQDQGNPATYDGFACWFTRSDGFGGGLVSTYRLDNGVATLLGSTDFDSGGLYSPGVRFGASIIGSTFTPYIDRSGSWSSFPTRSDSSYNIAGLYGVQAEDTTARLDNFGGGTI